MRFTDANIPIKCSDCNVVEEGIDNMMKHIITEHPTYTTEEAMTYARRWADAAYDEVMEQKDRWSEFIGWGKS